MKYYSEALDGFTSTHPFSVDRGQEMFDSHVLQWHNDLLAVQNAIHTDFDVIWSVTSLFDLSSMVLYIVRQCSNWYSHTIWFNSPLREVLLPCSIS